MKNEGCVVAMWSEVGPMHVCVVQYHRGTRRFTLPFFMVDGVVVGEVLNCLWWVSHVIVWARKKRFMEKIYVLKVPIF